MDPTFFVLSEDDLYRLIPSDPFDNQICVATGSTAEGYPLAYVGSVSSIAEPNLQSTMSAAFNGCEWNADDKNAFVLLVPTPADDIFDSIINNKSFTFSERDMLIAAEIIRQNGYLAIVCVSETSTTAFKGYLQSNNHLTREL